MDYHLLHCLLYCIFRSLMVLCPTSDVHELAKLFDLYGSAKSESESKSTK